MSDPIRVLHVFSTMNRGGAETLIMNLYRNIDRSKIQFDFVVHIQEKCAYDDEIKKLGGRIFRVPKYTGKNHFEYTKAWKNLAKDNQEHIIVHGHVRSTASIYLTIYKNMGRTTISHSHSTSSGKGVSAIAKNLMQYPIKFIADYFLACSRNAGVWLFGEKITKSNRFEIFNNAIDIDRFKFNEQIRQRIRSELNIQEKFVIGHVGRFHPAKNHAFLIEIFKRVHQINENAVLLLVGDGNLKNSIIEKVKKENLEECVIFTGIKPNVNDVLQAMDVFVFPSIYEGLGISIIEAQAAGLNCIVSDRIPDEAILSSLVHKVSLLKSAEFWSKKVLEMSKFERQDVSSQLYEAGYEIKDAVKWLTNYYIRMIK